MVPIRQNYKDLLREVQPSQGQKLVPFFPLRLVHLGKKLKIGRGEHCGSIEDIL
jgi:hypothetical protein